jgi:tetratricopeptide (TPR) repeat protein
MPREDYIRRLVVEMGRVWARLVGLIKSRQLPAARAVLAQAYQQILGLHADADRTLTPRELVARLMLGEAPAEGFDKCVAMAALLKASGDIASAEGTLDAAAEDYRKALEVLLTVLAHAPTVAELTQCLAMYALPLETNLLLMRYYEQVGAFAKAEDTLFEMLDAVPGDPDLLAIGRAFYGRLRSEADERLAAGDLTRREIEAGLAELDRYSA